MATHLEHSTRGSQSDVARDYRQRGHDDALLFALLIGLDKDYKRDPRAKKDVIDPAGDAHSVKSGKQKWQIFLYGRNRFLDDDGFQALNGIGQLLIHCIDAFPPRFLDYVNDKRIAKERLKTPMRELRDRFQRKALLRAFLRKSIFNGGEVNYLTIYHDAVFRVYWSDDIVTAMADKFEVTNSKARTMSQFDDQKVLFRFNGQNVGELEMRNDNETHYGEVRFNMNKLPAISLLDQSDFEHREYSSEIVTFGSAISKFGRW